MTKKKHTVTSITTVFWGKQC